MLVIGRYLFRAWDSREIKSIILSDFAMNEGNCQAIDNYLRKEWGGVLSKNRC